MEHRDPLSEDKRFSDLIDDHDLPSDAASSLGSDGARRYVHPADVRGRFSRLRRGTFLALIVVYVLLPWIPIGGHPAVFIDIENRHFFLFGGTFNAQDFWLVFFLLTGGGFFLFVMTTLLGRIWCGYACPQTVFLEGIYRRIERWIEGPRAKRMRLNLAPWTFNKIWRKTLKQGLYLCVSFVIAHVFLSYFVSLPAVIKMVQSAPGNHPEAFAWAIGLTLILNFNFAWFREQFCVILCPYGRLQSVLTDKDTLVVGYDSVRGEPRSRRTKNTSSEGQVGDCVECGRCVAVCPTGIDIRNGLQMDCIGCSACVDACDEIMMRLKRPTGLIRYDSMRGFATGAAQFWTRFWRPRIALYAGLGLAGLAAFGFAITHHQNYEANLLRMTSMPPYVRDLGHIRNAFELHIVNKFSSAKRFKIRSVDAAEGQRTIVSVPELRLASLASRRVPIFVTRPFQDGSQGTSVDKKALILEVRVVGESDAPLRLTAPFLGPSEKSAVSSSK